MPSALNLAEIELRYGVTVEVIPEGENEGAKMRVASRGPKPEFMPRFEPIVEPEADDLDEEEYAGEDEDEDDSREEPRRQRDEDRGEREGGDADGDGGRRKTPQASARPRAEIVKAARLVPRPTRDPNECRW